MGHIDYDAITTLDALIDVSDAAARATLVRLREQLDRLDPDLDERLVADSIHKKPTIAFYRNDDAFLHVYPEPGVGLGLHVALPIPEHQIDLITVDDLEPWVREAVLHARRLRGTLWVDATLHSPRKVDDVALLLARRLDLLPRVH